MRWSELFIPTLRELPAAAGSPARQLLARSGYLRGGAHLFLAFRSMQKVAALIRAGLLSMGAQEMRFPDPDSVLAAANDLRSYKQLPQLWFQIDGVQESWSFDINTERAAVVWDKHRDAYTRIAHACGLNCTPDFMVLLESGPDRILQCPACGAAANLELAASAPRPTGFADPAGDLPPEAFPTPGRKTIADVSAFTGLPESAQMKSLVLFSGGRLLLVLLRGDHQLSHARFSAATGLPDFRPATPAEIRETFGADPGSLGPVGVSRIPILADCALRGRRNMIAGANRDDYHLRNVTPGEDFAAEFVDLRLPAAGDTCLACGGEVRILNAMQIASLQRHERTLLHVSNAAGVETPLAVASFRLHLDRLLEAAAALHHDSDGLILPPPLAPFGVIITPVNLSDPVQQRVAEKIYRECLNAALDPLFDDRDERPGVKFKDADLIGVPFRITVGKKAVNGVVELVVRRGHAVTELAADVVAHRLREIYDN